MGDNKPIEDEVKALLRYWNCRVLFRAHKPALASIGKWY
jgi:hypothetical protein